MLRIALLSSLVAAVVHAGPVTARRITGVALSPDGKFVAATLSEDDEETRRFLVRMWNAQTGAELISYSGFGDDPTFGVAFSPDSKLLVAAANRHVLQVFDTATAKAVKTLGDESVYTFVTFSPDGSEVGACAEDGPHLFSVATGQPVDGPVGSRCNGIAYSADGSTLALGTSTLEVWTRGTKFPKKYDAVGFFPTLTKGGKQLFIADDSGHAQLFDTSTWQSVATTEEKESHLFDLRGAAIDPTSNTLVGAVKSGLVWLKLPEFKYKQSWEGEFADATSVVYSADGKAVVSGHGDGVVRLSDASSTKPKLVRAFGAKAGGAVATAKGDDAPAEKAASGYIGTPAPAGSEKLMEAVLEAVKLARHPPGYGTDPTPYGKECMAAVSRALASKIPDTAELRIDSLDPIAGGRTEEGSDSMRLVPLRFVNTSICVAAFAKGYLSTVSQSASRACTWLDKMKDPGGAYAKDLKDGSLLRLAVAEGQTCKKSVAEARKAGVPDSAEVEFSPYGSGISSPLSLGELEKQVCQAAITGMTLLKEADDARIAAAYAPYLKELSGDKQKMFKEQGCLGNTYYYGPGMKLLRTPADFKNASTWYWYSYDHSNPIRPTWNVSGFKFKGDAKVGTYSKAGVGEDPPASAFP